MECQDEKFIFYDFYSTQSLSCFGQPLAKAISPLNFPGFLITFSPWRPSLASASSSPLTTGRPWCKRRWPRCWPRPGGILKFWWWMTPPGRHRGGPGRFWVPDQIAALPCPPRGGGGQESWHLRGPGAVAGLPRLRRLVDAGKTGPADGLSGGASGTRPLPNRRNLGAAGA